MGVEHVVCGRLSWWDREESSWVPNDIHPHIQEQKISGTPLAWPTLNIIDQESPQKGEQYRLTKNWKTKNYFLSFEWIMYRKISFVSDVLLNPNDRKPCFKTGELPFNWSRVRHNESWKPNLACNPAAVSSVTLWRREHADDACTGHIQQKGIVPRYRGTHHERLEDRMRYCQRRLRKDKEGRIFQRNWRETFKKRSDCDIENAKKRNVFAGNIRTPQ